METASALKRILDGELVEFEFPGIVEVKFNFISGILNRVFHSLDIPFLAEPILVVLKELLSNAARANAKRQFFTENNLNIENDQEYFSGMNRFRDEVLNNWKAYAKSQEKAPYFLKLSLQLVDENIEFLITNNSQLTGSERNRISTRLKRFTGFKNIEAAFSSMADAEEGAGLGIIMSLFLMRKVGINPANLSMRTGAGKTQSRLLVPRSIAPVEFKERFRDEVIARIDNLPAIRQNVATLVEMCNSQGASLNQIAREIETDPSLTAQILKLVNTAGYMSRIQNPGILDAVKVVGLNVIKNLLLVTGSREVLTRHFSGKHLDKIWNESNRVSFYARQLSRQFPDIMDSAPVSGLLHLLGKIVLISLSPDVIQRVDSFMGGGKLLNSSLMEEMQLGISHPEIAAMLAEKWKFPPHLVSAIRFQQKPLLAPEEHSRLVHTIYFAIRIHQTLTNQLDYLAVEPETLELFKINSESAYNNLVENLSRQYDAYGSADE